MSVSAIPISRHAAGRSPLLEPVRLGDLSLPNRVVMAPLTRMRAGPGEVPTPLMALYYAQRAGAGLIISEATQIEQRGQGYPETPGTFTDAQCEGWAKVTQTVHTIGGRIFLQLWHVGRISHSSHQPGGALPIAPSAIAAPGHAFTANWTQAPFETPRALETAEIPGLVATYAAAARRALAAGFDGVEIHGANGYLINQFLEDGTNHRTDAYGGSMERRARFLLEVTDAVAAEAGPGRVGVRLSPWGTFSGMGDSNPRAHYGYAIRELAKRRLAYLHLIEPRSTNAGAEDALARDVPSALVEFGAAFDGPVVSAGGYTPATAERAIAGGLAAAVAFGRIFIANPDLPVRIALGAPLTPYDRSTFYGGDSKGYTDYPFLAGLNGEEQPAS